MAASYVELHCHSAYSFADGASLPEELAAQAELLGYPALALTDHNGLYGAMEFAQQVKGRGLQAIIGAEATLEDESHLTLLAENPTGYAHLCRLLTAAHRRGERGKPRLPLSLLEQYGEGLVVLSGCRHGAIARAVDAGDLKRAEVVARRYREWFGREAFFIELQQNRVHRDTARIRALVELARRLELEVVATNNVHYHRRERHQLQDALVAIRHRTTLDQSHALRRANSEFHLKPAGEMSRLFRQLPEAIGNTLRIAERCRDFDLTQNLGYAFPDFHRGAPGGPVAADDALAQVCREALALRYRGEPERIRREAFQRLREELELVRHHRLSGFFLVHRDILELAKEAAARVRGQRGVPFGRSRFALPPGRGRGSSVSSIICYLIGLSPVDPIKARLSLGRFLNRELSSVPDIDLDFPRDIREELIRAVHRHYGAEHAAMVATFPTYRLRATVRDLGKALGLPEPEIDRLSRLSEGGRADTVEAEMLRLPGFEQALETEPWRHLIRLARELRGFPRHLSQHSGGMIISSRPLVELLPVERSRMEGRLVCQWDKDSCDDARFIKIDFLSLATLSAVEECLDLVEENGKPPVDLSRIPLDDAAVYDRICAGETVGVFQIESRAQIQMLPRTQPRNMEELAIEIAIVRPGPIIGGAVNPYVRRRERRRQNPNAGPCYDHPLLIPVLEETLGVILYQDQVLGVSQALAGFSIGRAEALRRAMSRRRSLEAMERFREEFLAGAAANGVHPRTAGRIFEKLLGFSNYGFPKAHAASFAILAYQTAWLCHYYPAEYIASVLNQLPMGFYPRDVLLKDAQRRGVAFTRPDINQSGARCQVSGEGVRLGLGFVEGLGTRYAGRIVAARERGGEFRSLPDFLRRAPLPCGMVESLIQVGALDGFGLERRLLLWELGLLARAQGWMNPNKPGAGSETARRQTSFFFSAEQDRVSLTPMSPWERMLTDYARMELSPDTHPMTLLRPACPKGAATTAQLAHLTDGKQVQLAGLVVTRQRPGSAKGFLFLLIEDEFGLVNVVISPRLYEQRRAVLRGEPLLWLRGTVQRRGGVLNIIAADVGALTDALREHEPLLSPDDPAAAFLDDLRQAAPSVHQWR